MPPSMRSPAARDPVRNSLRLEGRPNLSPTSPPIFIEPVFSVVMEQAAYENATTVPARSLELQNAEELMKDIIIPPRPSILIDVLNEQAKSDPDLGQIATLIGKDVAISAGVLRVVNSAFFGLPRKITSIDHAVRLIGVRSVTNIVTALMLHSAFADSRGGFMDEFWNDSGRLAAAAAFASKLSSVVAPEEGYAIGLFANCGVPLMHRKFPEYASVYERARLTNDISITLMEDAELDTNHTLVGYIMGKKWDLPESFCQCILRHHDTTDYCVDPDGRQDEVTPYLAVLQLSQYFSRAHDGRSDGFEWSQIGRSVLAYLGVSDADFDALTRDALGAIEDAGTLVA